MAKQKDTKGLTVRKSDLSDWYSEVILKAELADYAPIKGFMIIRPNAYSIWEKIQEYFNKTLKRLNIKNSYFPLLIPESFFKKEAEHAAGFNPELAYIEGTEEGEKLALRPTSETIMYDSYSRWIRSYKDLPYQLNQWCNVIRWEVKQTKPFIRTREFLWQEGHSAFQTEEEAIHNMDHIAQEYKTMMESLLAIPVIVGKKSKMEKFPGAVTTTTIEALMPDGKALQMGTSHNLGQGFSKSFNIKFLDENEKTKFPFQTSWGFSTRLIGAVIMVHGDDKGLVLPPKIAENKLVIIPILFEKGKLAVQKKANELSKKLAKFNPILDNREEYSPGYKFNEYELKGIPIRIEIGPKDIKKKSVTLVRRDSGKKQVISENKLSNEIPKILEDIQLTLFKKAKKFLESNITEAKNMKELKQKIKERKIVKAYMLDDPKVEENIKAETNGANSRIIEIAKPGTCIWSKKPTNTISYFAKAY